METPEEVVLIETPTLELELELELAPEVALDDAPPETTFKLGRSTVTAGGETSIPGTFT